MVSVEKSGWWWAAISCHSFRNLNLRPSVWASFWFEYDNSLCNVRTSIHLSVRLPVTDWHS